LSILTLLVPPALGQSSDPSEGNDLNAPAPPVALDAAAEQTFDYLIQHCTCRPAGADFWKNPTDGGVGSDQNGWQGAQGLQSAVINYECTHESKYLDLISRFADWCREMYRGRDHLALCGTSASYDAEGKGVGSLPSHFSMWDDDAGWVMNMYLQFYHYTNQSSFLDAAYQTLVNGDKYWGEDFQDNSRGLRYKDREDHYPIYMSAQIIAALGIADAEKTAGDNDKAAAAMVLAEKYDNFVENYLHSTGRGELNITGTPFTAARNIYQIACSFGTGPKSPAPDAKSKLHAGFFTSPQMMMAAAYVMFDQAVANGADVSLVDPKFRDFHQRALDAADAFTTAYPDGYLEDASSGPGQVFIDACDPNVNGFGCYWWAKYVVPLNPGRYGQVVIRTAREIIANQGTGNISSSLWNTPKDATGRGGSHSVHADTPSWAMVRDATACSIVASANWIDKTYPNLGTAK
jgi:hypothetical protein